MARALSAAGIRVLENGWLALAWRGTALWVAGLADATERAPDVDATLAAVPADGPCCS